jgi:hypothetical protein
VNEDFLDFLRALLAAEAQFLVVGAHALAVHGIPRATEDLDIWIRRDPANARRVWAALAEFGAPLDELHITMNDLQRSEAVIQIGLPPRRIDLLSDVSGLTFEEAWAERHVQSLGPIVVPFLGRAALIRNKRAAGRLKDLADLESLGERADC